MKFTLPPGAFPPLTLSGRRQHALLDEAQRVVDETLADNEAFIAAGRVLRSSQWRLVRTKEAIQVYQQRANASTSADADDVLVLPETPDRHRRARRRGMTASANTIEVSDFNTFDPDNMTIVEAMKRPQVPLLALHGVVEGTLDDTMYGIFADDDLSWRWRSAHVNDRFDDAKLLATLARPDAGDPFRFAGVKWFAKEHPAVLSSFVHRRDFVIVEASGLTKDSQGNRVGYMLMHSVTLRGVPELSELGIIRGCLSFCYLVRQREGDARTVEIFGRGFSDPLGDMMERVSVAIASEALIAAVTVVDYAYVKKLTYFAKRYKQQHKQAGRLSEGDGSDKTQRCESCRSQTGIGGGGASSGRVLSGILSAVAAVGAATQCNICRRRVCSKCSVLKKMTVDVSPHAAVQRTLRFCVKCVMQAKEASAWDIAIRALTKSQTQSASSSSSSSSPSSSTATPSSASTPSASAPAPISAPMPPQPPLPRRQRSEELPPRSRVTRAYSHQVPSARFAYKTRFPTAPAAVSTHGDSKSKLHNVAPTTAAPSAPGSTSRSVRSSRKTYDVLSDTTDVPLYVPVPRRQPTRATESAPERHSERLPYHVAL